mmetsp:Transcript_113784/g.332342  ORF Transcript_113784/g.332342 Transcript_113784/m.332342 type:complete len:219 (-) Transcript_113784:24-680(-)
MLGNSRTFHDKRCSGSCSSSASRSATGWWSDCASAKAWRSMPCCSAVARSSAASLRAVSSASCWPPCSSCSASASRQRRCTSSRPRVQTASTFFTKFGYSFPPGSAFRSCSGILSDFLGGPYGRSPASRAASSARTASCGKASLLVIRGRSTSATTLIASKVFSAWALSSSARSSNAAAKAASSLCWHAARASNTSSRKADTSWRVSSKVRMRTSDAI